MMYKYQIYKSLLIKLNKNYIIVYICFLKKVYLINSLIRRDDLYGNSNRKFRRKIKR